MIALLVLALCGASHAQEWNLVWEDNFDFFDSSKWDHEVTAWGGGNFEFQTYTPSSDNSYVKDGKLYIIPTLTVDSTNPATGEPFGEDFLTNGVLDVTGLYGRCTSNNNGGCFRTGANNDIPPVMSARLRTAERFAFQYGKVEIRAKMPVGDWIWPAMWMLPEDWVYGGWPASGEIDIIETIANRDLKFLDGSDTGTQRMGSTLHWGVDPSQNRFYLTSEHIYDYQRNFGDFFHTYVVEWDADGITWYVDDRFIYRVPDQPISELEDWSFFEYGKPWNNNDDNPWRNRPGAAPFDQDFHFLLNVAVGGTNGFIPDDVINRGDNERYGKPWFNGQDYREAMNDFYNARDRWHWTWQATEGENSAMQVDYVKVYQRA